MYNGIFRKFLVTLVALLAVACTDTEQFRVNGTLEGKPSINLRATYYDGTALRSVITAARNGEFEFYASAPQPALLELTDYDGRRLAYLYVVNGETYTVAIDPANPYAVTADGNDVNVRWSTFLRENAELLVADPDSVVAAYVAANPADVVSTLLMLTTYNSSQHALAADSLMSLIAPEARPSMLTDGYNYLLQRLVTAERYDTISPVAFVRSGAIMDTLRPSDARVSLIAISNERPNGLVDGLRELHKRPAARRPGILDLSLAADTVTWHNAVRNDSAKWHQGWMPGGLAARGVDVLGVPTLPWFIVVDSIGVQRYRGEDLEKARAAVDSILN